jgi:Rhodanese-related sulfurtransferase
MTIVDVREPHERAILRFPNAVVIPIGQLARRQKELDPNKDTVFICKQGKRSILAIKHAARSGLHGAALQPEGRRRCHEGHHVLARRRLVIITDYSAINQYKNS